MPACCDERFKKMIPLFELGLLSETDRRRFETHLLECDECFHDVRGFHREAQLIREDQDVRGVVNRELDSGEVGIRTESVAPERRNRWKVLASSSLAAAAVLAILILKPWHLEIRPTEEVVAAENRIAIIPLNNLMQPTDPDRTAEILTALLITDLSESRYVQVVSAQRIKDVAGLLGIADSSMADRNLALKVAREASARWMLQGSILSDAKGITVTGHLVEVATNREMAALRATTTDDDRYSLVDRLAVETKKHLALPPDAYKETDRRVADVTTHSWDAYQHYITGVELNAKMYRLEAIESFRKALQFDSTFAMAYYYLARLSDGSLITRAVEYASKASRRERYYILSYEAVIDGNLMQAVAELTALVEHYPDDKQAFFELARCKWWINERDEAISYLYRAIALDPTYREAYNQLAYIYSGAREFDKALRAINTYIELAPDEANPYDSRGDVYRFYGDLDKALESYQQALNIKPDFHNSLVGIGNILIFKGDYEAAAEWLQELARNEDLNIRGTARLDLANIYIRQGRFERAYFVLDSAITVNIEDNIAGGLAGDCPFYHYLKARLFSIMNESERALAEIEIALTMGDDTYPDANRAMWESLHVRILAQTGDLNGAQQRLDALKQHLIDYDTDLYKFLIEAGNLELIKGNAERAVQYFQQAVESAGISLDFVSGYMLGRAYLEMGRGPDAVRELEQQLDNYSLSRVLMGFQEDVRIRYYLGAAYEASGRLTEAGDQYEVFLDQWKNADSGLAEVEDARARLAELRNRM